MRAVWRATPSTRHFPAHSMRHHMHYYMIRHLIYFSLLALALTACSTTRYVGEGEYLLDRVRIEADYSPTPTANLKSYLHQHPNQKIFGLVKWPLYIYNRSS